MREGINEMSTIQNSCNFVIFKNLLSFELITSSYIYLERVEDKLTDESQNAFPK